jgi:hypothetical protein
LPAAPHKPKEGIVLTHFIVSADVERSRRFDVDVLGCETVRSGLPPCVALANSFIVINVGGGPTEDKPTVTLETPPDPDRVSAFLNIRVADIQTVYGEWRLRGAEFLTPPEKRKTEHRERRAGFRSEAAGLEGSAASERWRRFGSRRRSAPRRRDAGFDPLLDPGGHRVEPREAGPDGRVGGLVEADAAVDEGRRQAGGYRGRRSHDRSFHVAADRRPNGAHRPERDLPDRMVQLLLAPALGLLDGAVPLGVGGGEPWVGVQPVQLGRDLCGNRIHRRTIALARNGTRSTRLKPRPLRSSIACTAIVGREPGSP